MNFEPDYEPEHFEAMDPIVEVSQDRKIVGRAVAWLVLVGVAIGVGFAVDRFAVRHAMSPMVSLVSVISTSAVTLIAGIVFVVLSNNN